MKKLEKRSAEDSKGTSSDVQTESDVINKDEIKAQSEKVHDVREGEKRIAKDSIEDDISLISKSESDEAGGRNQKKINLAKLILGIFTTTAVLGGAGYLIFKKDNLINIVNFANDDVPTPALVRISKLERELLSVKDELKLARGFRGAFESMEDNQKKLEQQLDNLKLKVEGEFKLVSSASESRMDRLTKIKKQLSDLAKSEERDDELVRADIENLRLEMVKIDNQGKEERDALLEKIKNYKSMNDLANGEAVPVEKEKTKSQEESKRAKGKIVKLGPLKLERINRYGNQNVAELTDGISGAIPVVDGDLIGRYTIKKVTQDSVVIESLSGEGFVLVLEEG